MEGEKKVEIIHKIKGDSIFRDVKGENSFLLTNKAGGYIYLSNSPERKSRYEGVFFSIKDRLLKVIADIKINLEIEKVENEFFFVKRSYKNEVIESYFFPHGFNSLVYENKCKKENFFSLKLDVRDIYSTNEKFGRYFEIVEINKGRIVIKYTKVNESGENELSFKCYLVISSPKEIVFKKNNIWEEIFYEGDKKRSSYPVSLYVYDALKIKGGGTFVLSFSDKKTEAIKESDYVLENIKRLKEKQKKEIESFVEISNLKKEMIKKEYKFAMVCAKNSLNELTSGNHILAGLPWFFQFWSRDELISIKSFKKQEKKRVLLEYLDKIKDDGRLPNITSKNNEKTNADSIGWLFKRFSDDLVIFNGIERGLIKYRLISAINRIERNYMKNGFIYNGKKETWMDSTSSIYEKNNGRSGAKIEIQTMFLNMLNLAYRLTGDEIYSIKEKRLADRIKNKFWNKEKGILSDGIKDFTIRPNIFLAYYFYPKLLQKKEWINIFENSLGKLWLKWGGLSSIDKESQHFIPYDTGEDPKSYHNGNSWFFMNNLTALCLNRLNNNKKFKNYVKNILESSTNEILWEGAIGHHAEVSSAEEKSSVGCVAQAWSSATYIELVNELFTLIL